MANKTKPPAPKRTPKTTVTETSGTILVWEDDPGSGGDPIVVTAPQAPLEGLTFTIRDFPGTPRPAQYLVGSTESRYWIAYEALCRSLNLWRSILDLDVPNVRWQGNTDTLSVGITSLVELNAYYSREYGLDFGNQAVKSGHIYTSDSPDIVAHELGHAVLDSLRPDLYDAPSDEIGAFHESFADISSLLTTLQLKSFRRAVIEETGGNLQYNSRLSRLAEQVAAGIRERRPDTVDTDCMRNAANSFFYSKPSELQPTGPAIILTSSRHSFSRVFTGAFLEVLAGLTYPSGNRQTPVESDLATAVKDAGRLLVRAVREAEFVPQFFHEVAVQMVHADRSLFESKYQKHLISAFVRRGIIQVEEASQLENFIPSGRRTSQRKGMAASDRAAAASPGRSIQIEGRELGFGDIRILVPIGDSAPRKLGLSENEGMRAGRLNSGAWVDAPTLFVKNLVRRGRIDVPESLSRNVAIYPPRFAEGKRTHILEPHENFARIRRACFDF